MSKASNRGASEIPPITFDPSTSEVTNPRGVLAVYANNAAVMAMQHDLRLVFSEIVADGAANPPRLELRANIVVAPTMLKALHDAIAKTLEMYEDKIGEVVWPPKPHMTELISLLSLPPQTLGVTSSSVRPVHGRAT